MDNKRKKIYHVWVNMKGRCYDPRSDSYKYYGSRGIKICEEWLDFDNFYKWAINGYKEGLTIERKNNNGNYCPENCTWATYSEQANNKSNTIYLTIDGKKRSISNWCRLYKINVTIQPDPLEKNLILE